jgi:hypothetical protein
MPIDQQLIDEAYGITGKQSTGQNGRRREVAFDYQRPTLYPKQEAAIFDERRMSIIEASTKSGKTAGCVVWLGEQALHGKAGQNFWWVAPVTSQADIAFTRMMRALPRTVFHPYHTGMAEGRPPGAIAQPIGNEFEAVKAKAAGQSGQPLAREVLDELMKRSLQLVRYYYPLDSQGNIRMRDVRDAEGNVVERVEAGQLRALRGDVESMRRL